MVHQFHSKELCPRCLSQKVQLQKGGLEQMLRKMIMNPRMVCGNCSYSWVKNKAYQECAVAVRAHYR